MYKFVLFDLDGTLTDPAEGILKSVRYALQKEGFETFPDQDLRWVIGPPLKDSLAQLARSTDNEVIRRLLAGYRERFGTVGLYENEVFAGIPELLETLVEQGCKLFVATSKPTVYAKRILQHFALESFFVDIVGSELDESRSSKGDVIHYLLSTANLAGDECVMVGDRMHDVIGARENGIKTVGVLYGFGSEEELAKAGAVYLAKTVTELHHLLTGIVCS